MSIFKSLVVSFSFLLVFSSCQESKENLSNQISSKPISEVDLFYELDQNEMIQVNEREVQQYILNILAIEKAEFKESKVVTTNNYSVIESVITVNGKTQNVGILLENYKEQGVEPAYLLGKICYCKGPNCQLTIVDGGCACNSSEDDICTKTVAAQVGGTYKEIFE